MNSQKVVIPVKTGIQRQVNSFKILDSRLRENDGKMTFPTFYEGIKVWVI